jgi:FKBP-type peptidyl-prolyl cis-trans isomerase
MKKVSFLMAIAFAAILASCTGKAPKANLKTDVDSLSYAIGMAQTQGLKDYLIRMNMDTTYMDEFIKGLKEGVKKTSKKKDAYFMGIQIGQQIKNQVIKGINHELFGQDSTKTINIDNFLSGFISGTLGKKGDMTVQQAQTYAQMNMERIKSKSLEKQYGANKAAGDKFLSENKSKPGIITLPDGVQYKVVKAGNGPTPKDTSKVTVNYRGTTIDGKEFDSSYKRKQPATFVANQVIKGWTEILTKMPAGSKWIVYIPQNLAYGSRDTGSIKPFSTLIFEIELLSVGGK